MAGREQSHKPKNSKFLTNMWFWTKVAECQRSEVLGESKKMECYGQRKVELPSGADLQRERGRDGESVC